MYTGLIDTINSIIQSIMFVVAANYCVSEKHKKSKNHLILLIISLWIIITLTTYLLGNSSLSIIIIHITELIFFVIFAYKNDKLGATIGFTIVYLIIGITVIVSFFTFILIINNTNINITYANILIMYLPQFLVSYLVLKNIKFIYKINLIIKSRTFFYFYINNNNISCRFYYIFFIYIQ